MYLRMLDGPLFLLCLGDCSILLGLNVWFLIILSDLECDYINASSACQQLNSYILVSIYIYTIYIYNIIYLARNSCSSSWYDIFDYKLALDFIYY